VTYSRGDIVSGLKIRQIIDSDAEDFPQWLTDEIAAAKNRNVRVAAIARAADITTSYLYRLMRGKGDSVSLEVVQAIEKALGVKYRGGDRT